MTLRVDKAGRIVLPKPLRERLRLKPGSALALEELPEGVFLRPLHQCASLVEKAGLLMHVGQAPSAFDWARLVEDHREERLQDVAGL